METTSRMPSNFSAFNGPNPNSLRFDAAVITSPMAASFREEKLALRTNGLVVTGSPGELSASGEGDQL